MIRTVGPTDPNLVLDVTVVLHRHQHHIPLPHLDEYKNCPHRHRLSSDEFAARHGASQHDIDRVEAYCRHAGLTVLESHRAARTVQIQATVGYLNAAWGVTITDHERDEHDGPYRYRDHAAIETHGLPIMAIMGMASPPRTRANISFDPPNSVPLTPQQISSFYQGVAVPATGQVIGIAGGGVSQTDINATFQRWGLTPPTITNVFAVPGINVAPNLENTLDVCAAAGCGQGAKIAMYIDNSSGISFATYSRMIHPAAGDPVCSIISFSFIFGVNVTSANVGDYAPYEQLWADAAALGITMLTSSGDYGTMGGNSTQLIANYPPMSPYMTGVGGTVIGNASGQTFTEWTWQDGYGNATGGGVSQAFPVPAFQQGLTLPRDLVTGNLGRCVPDISATASGASGLQLFFNGQLYTVGGTSQSTPILAGLFACVNAFLKRNLGYLNTTLYAIGSGNAIIRDIVPGGGSATDNRCYPNPQGGQSFAGYQVTTGYDLCTGLGVVNMAAFTTYIENNQPTYVMLQPFNSVGAGPGAVAGPFHSNPITATPTDPVFINATANTLTFAWSLPAGTYDFFQPITFIPGNTFSTVVTTPVTQTGPRTWQVTAVGLPTGEVDVSVAAHTVAGGWSPFANFVAMTTGQNVTKPTNLHLVSMGPTSITIGWRYLGPWTSFAVFYFANGGSGVQWTGSAPIQTGQEWTLALSGLAGGNYIFGLSVTDGVTFTPYVYSDSYFVGALPGTVLGMTQIRGSAPLDSAINLLFMAEGYLASQQAQFNAAVETYVDFWLGFNAIAPHVSQINVFRLNLASVEAGVGNDGGALVVKNFFGSAFPGPNPTNTSLILDLASQYLPEHTCMPILFDNTATFFGYAASWGATFPANNSFGPLVMVHEMGHALFDLSDEYNSPDLIARGFGGTTYTGSPPLSSPRGVIPPYNATSGTTVATISWHDLLTSTSPIPIVHNTNCANTSDVNNVTSPYPASTVGLFETAQYWNCGVYRAQFDCVMHSEFVPNVTFCAPCLRNLNKVFDRLGTINVAPTVIATTAPTQLRLSFRHQDHHVQLVRVDRIYASPAPATTVAAGYHVIAKAADGSHLHQVGVYRGFENFVVTPDDNFERIVVPNHHRHGAFNVVIPNHVDLHQVSLVKISYTNHHPIIQEIASFEIMKHLVLGN